MWYFVSPQIVFGEGALDALDDVKGTRALLVTDTTLVKVGLVDTVTAHLRKVGLAWRVFDAVEPDPSTDTALAGARVALEYEPDWIINGKWANGRMSEWANERMGEWANERMGEWVNGRMGEWANERMGEWANEQTIPYSPFADSTIR